MPNLRLLYLLLSCAFLTVARAQEEIVFTQAAAQAALNAEKYREAATILDSLEKTGQVSHTFYLALGNARFNAGEIGRAILAYERGLRLRPANKDLLNNLKFVREEAGIVRPALPDFILLRWWKQIGALLGVNTTYLIGIVFWWLAVVGAVYWYLQRKQMEEKRRFALLPLAFACVGLAILFMSLGASRHAHLTEKNEAVLTAATAVLRVSPTPEGSVEAELEQGWKVYITDRVNGYVKVVLADGRTGYLEKASVELI